MCVFMHPPQTVSWLGAESSVLDDCVHSVSEPTDLKLLLQHHKQLGHLEQHGKSLPISIEAVFLRRSYSTVTSLSFSVQFHRPAWAAASCPPFLQLRLAKRANLRKYPADRIHCKATGMTRAPCHTWMTYPLRSSL